MTEEALNKIINLALENERLNNKVFELIDEKRHIQEKIVNFIKDDIKYYFKRIQRV